jgi:hypothetical protein
MNKRILAVMVLCFIIPFSMSARSLYDVSLGFGGSYSPSEDSDYFDQMTDPSNWNFGAELSVRVAFLQAQTLVFPLQCSDGGQGALLLGMAGLNTPLLGNLLQLELGVGASVIYVLSDDDDGTSYYELADKSSASTSDTGFFEAVSDSPIYLMAGLGTQIGAVGIHARYLMESNATINSLSASQSWWKVFNIEESTLSLALTLKMF